MCDVKENRYHYIKIDNVKLENYILCVMREMYEKEDSEVMGNLLYATDNSLTGGNGDSFYSPTFRDDVKSISILFPEIIFTCGWYNCVEKTDKNEYVIQNGEIVNTPINR